MFNNRALVKFDSPHPTDTSGGSCDIFRGRHRKFGTVALKRPRDTKTRNLFLAEAEIWSTLTHDYVHRFLGTYEEDGHLYLLSPWEENGSLRNYMRTHPQVDRLRLLRETAEALAYLHRRGVIHGDVKSTNILVSSDVHALLCDFGLTRLTSIATASALKGQGTPRWQAPELFGGSPKSYKTDVYAFGMTMYEVLTGRVPFDDVENTFYLVTLIQKGERPPIPDCGRYASSPIWEVVARCWAPTPDQRPTMEEVVEALKEIPSPPPDRSAPERRLPIPFPQYDDHEMLKTSPSPRRHLHLPSLSLSSIFRTTWSSAGTVKLSDGTTVVLKSMAPSVFSSTCDILIGTVRSTETLVALKRLRVSQTNASTRKEVEQIENECRLWKDLHHPNILQFMGVGKDDKGNQYLVSRWMKNGSLWKHIKTHPDDHCDRSRYLREVAEALVYLHDEKQMVHGDIRASNIIISDTLHALLCDFGRSRPINEEPFESWSGETRNWQSPELLEGGKVTFASDVYAFGMTIYQVLSGKEPFYEYDQASILHAVIIDNDRPQKEPSMLSTDEDYSRLWMIAERCWKRNPEERPSMSTVLRWMEGQNLSELEMP